MVTIGVSADRSCADQFRLPQKYMLNPQQRAMKLFLVGIRFYSGSPYSRTFRIRDAPTFLAQDCE